MIMDIDIGWISIFDDEAGGFILKNRKAFLWISLKNR